ncbi:hypothetical protein D9M68_493800 [compost metagenome]
MHVIDGVIAAQEVVGHTYLLAEVAVDQDHQIIAIAVEAQAAARHVQKEHTIEAATTVVDDIHPAIRAVVVGIVAGTADQGIVAILADQDVVAGAADQQVVARAVVLAVATRQVVVAITTFDLVVTAHAEQRIVARQATQQIATVVASQLLAGGRAFDQRLEIARHALRGDDMADALGGQQVAARGLHVTDGLVATQEVIEHTHRLGRVAIDQDQQIVAVATEGEAILTDTVGEEHTIVASAAVVDDVYAAVRCIDVLVVPRAAYQQVVAGTTVELVVAAATEQRVVAGFAFQIIVAAFAMDQVIASTPPGLVVAIAQTDMIVEVAVADETVDPGGALPDHPVLHVCLTQLTAVGEQEMLQLEVVGGLLEPVLHRDRVGAIGMLDDQVVTAAHEAQVACSNAGAETQGIGARLDVAVGLSRSALDQQVVAVAQVEDVGVVAERAIERIVAGATFQDIAALVPGVAVGFQHVVARTTTQGVEALAEQSVVSGTAEQFATAFEQVVAVPTVEQAVPLEDVVARAAIQFVEATATDQQVVPFAAMQGIVAPAAVEQVVTSVTGQQVITVAAVERIGAIAAVNLVVAILAMNDVITRTGVDQIIVWMPEDLVRISSTG